MNESRALHAMVTDGMVIFVFGGWSRGPISSAECLDESRQHWRMLAQMPCPAGNCHAFFISNRIYVLSSYDQKTLTYDINSNSWMMKAPCPAMNWRSSMACVGDCIFVVGGDASTQCMRYNTCSDTWSELTVPHNLHQYGSAVSHQGKVYLSGGFADSPFNIEEYDPENDQWKDTGIALPMQLNSHCMLMMK